MGFLSRLLGTADGGDDLVADLLEAYRGEAEHAARLRQHADPRTLPAGGRRPCGASPTSRIVTPAGCVTASSRWAAACRRSLPLPPVARNQWERAVAAREEAQRKRRRLVELITRWDPEHPEDGALLQRVEREDTGALDAYQDLVMRSDPHALD